MDGAVHGLGFGNITAFLDFLSAPLIRTSWSTIALCLASLFRITACIST